VERCPHLPPDAPARSSWFPPFDDQLRCDLCAVLYASYQLTSHHRCCSVCGEGYWDLGGMFVAGTVVIVAVVCQECLDQPDTSGRGPFGWN